MRRFVPAVVLVVMILMGVAAPALACGGLVASNGSISLLRTATLVAYHEGIEHYVTSFEFAGGGAEFGSIIPLPGIPSDVKRGGRWTLQRLQQEVQPPVPTALAKADGAVATRSAEVILETKIEALDITILKGGGDEVGEWAKDNGFALPPDAPEVLDFYAARSPIFMAARFDVGRARDRGLAPGDGTPIHLVIPTQSPWVPLRILALGRQPQEIVQADVFLLTDAEPVLLPAPRRKGFALERSETATPLLLSDLRSDKGMGWLPAQDMHLSYVRIDSRAKDLTHDLAIEPTGRAMPSYVAAGLVAPPAPGDPQPADTEPGIPWRGLGAGAVLISLLALYAARPPKNLGNGF